MTTDDTDLRLRSNLHPCQFHIYGSPHFHSKSSLERLIDSSQLRIPSSNLLQPIQHYLQRFLMLSFLLAYISLSLVELQRVPC